MNEHSVKFETVKSYYENKLWNEEMVYNAIGRWITEEEYNEIVNKG